MHQPAPDIRQQIADLVAAGLDFVTAEMRVVSICTHCQHQEVSHPFDGTWMPCTVPDCECTHFHFSLVVWRYCGHRSDADPCPREIAPQESRRKKLPYRKVWDRDGWECVECGSHRELTVDHIVPVSKGGTDEPGNLQTMCKSCNSRKGNRA